MLAAAAVKNKVVLMGSFSVEETLNELRRNNGVLRALSEVPPVGLVPLGRARASTRPADITIL